MKHYPDIEELFTKVHSAKTRELVVEVYHCYTVGAYRPAIVMLWTVVISDLMFKLEELSEIYEDTKANEILKDIKTAWIKSPTSSEWEKNILERVYSNFTFVSEILKIEIEHLKQLRNICAHPTYGHELNLFHPNGEQCKGLLRTFLDGLFILPPLNHKAITDSLLNDLSENKSIFVKDDVLKSYLEEKYFLKTNPKVLEKLFRSLWKIIFRLESDDSKENRSINARALCILTEQKGVPFLEAIDKEGDYYNNISDEDIILQTLAWYLVKYPFLIDKINTSNKIKIKEAIKKEFDIFAVCSIFYDINVWEDHLIQVISTKYFFGVATKFHDYYMKLSLEGRNKLHQKVMSMYYSSGSYAEADKNFGHLKGIFTYLTKDEWTFLAEKIGNNSQTHSRNGAKGDHYELFDFVYRKFPTEYAEILSNLPGLGTFVARATS